MITMSNAYQVTVNGEALFAFSTLGNAGTVHDKIKARVPGVEVELVMPDGGALVNPTFPEALEFLAEVKGFTVLDKSGKAQAAPEPVKPEPVRKTTPRTRTRATATAAKPATRKAPRKTAAAK